MNPSTYQSPAVGQRWRSTITGKTCTIVTVLSEGDERARDGKCIEVRFPNSTKYRPTWWYTRAEFLGAALPEPPDPEAFPGPDPTETRR